MSIINMNIITGGVKYASGNVTTQENMEVKGLDFRPFIVYLWDYTNDLGGRILYSPEKSFIEAGYNSLDSNYGEESGSCYEGGFRFIWNKSGTRNVKWFAYGD